MGLRIHYKCYLEMIRNKGITDDNRVNLFIFSIFFLYFLNLEIHWIHKELVPKQVLM